jgi:hypothetical protein
MGGITTNEAKLIEKSAHRGWRFDQQECVERWIRQLNGHIPQLWIKKLVSTGSGEIYSLYWFEISRPSGNSWMYIWLGQTGISVGKLIRTSCFGVGLWASGVLFNRYPRSSRNSELLKIVRGGYGWSLYRPQRWEENEEAGHQPKDSKEKERIKREPPKRLR